MFYGLQTTAPGAVVPEPATLEKPAAAGKDASKDEDAETKYVEEKDELEEIILTGIVSQYLAMARSSAVRETFDSAMEDDDMTTEQSAAALSMIVGRMSKPGRETALIIMAIIRISRLEKVDPNIRKTAMLLLSAQAHFIGQARSGDDSGDDSSSKAKAQAKALQLGKNLAASIRKRFGFDD